MNLEEMTKEQLLTELQRSRRLLAEQRQELQLGKHVAERFKLAMEACKDGVWDWDLTSGQIYYSPGYYSMLGYGKDEFFSHLSDWKLLVHPNDWPAFEQTNNDCIYNDLDQFQVEFRIKSKSGKWIWILGRGQAVARDRHGKALRLVGTITDISRLKESENRFIGLYETTASAIVTIDFRGQYTSWNSAWLEMLGYTDLEMRNINPHDITHPDDVKVGERNALALMEGKTERYHQEKRFIRKDGSVLWVDLSATAIKNGAGAVDGLLGVITDISKHKKAQAELRIGRERYRAMIHSMSSGVVVVEAVDGGDDFIFRDFNPAAEIMTMKSRDEVVGRRLFTCFPALRELGLLEVLLRVWQTGRPEQMDPLNYSGDGLKSWFKYRLYKLPSGELVVLFDDVTEKLEAEKAREVSEQRLKMALEAVDDAVWEWNVETGDAYFSPRWYTMLGYEPYEMPQSYETWSRLLHPEDRGRVIDQVMRDTEHGDSFNVEMRMRTKENRWNWVMGRGMVVELNEQGKAVRMLGTHVDINERVLAMEGVKESELRFRSLLENVGMVAVRGYDEQMRVIFWNRASEELYGYGRGEVLGKDYGALPLYSEVGREVRQKIKGWIEGGTPYPAGEITLRHKNTSLLSVYSSHVVLLNSQGEKEYYCIDVNLTELKLASSQLIEAKEQAEAANRSKSLFLANMSHELRTPLNGIMGMHHLLELDALSKRQKEYLALAQHSVTRLTNLLNDILDLARVEAGRMELKNRPFDLRSLLADTEQLFRAAGSHEMVSLGFQVDEQVPEKLAGDSTRLQQVLNNLVGNAIKFTPKGSISVRASLLPEIRENEIRVLFSVADTGMGISDALQVKIFDSFAQGDESYSRTQQGAGLGLSIVKQLVVLMGGSIALESELNKGTTFWFSLPFQVVAPVGENIGKGVTCRENNLLPSTVLLVEDDDISRIVMENLLKRFGCRVLLAEDGKQAVYLLKEQHFDLVFMDVQMPVMDGVTATKAIRAGASGPENKKIPIIALTAYAMSGDREKLLKAGMDDYIEKPIEPDALLDVLRNISCQN